VAPLHDAAAVAAAEVIVRISCGPGVKVEPWHVAMAREALDAAEPHRPRDEDSNTRDVRSTLNATTERSYPPWTYDAARRIQAGGPGFGFGVPQ